MSKGRKNATSDRQYRLLGAYGHDRGVGPDLDEDDVWRTVEPDREDPWRTGPDRSDRPVRSDRTRRRSDRDDDRRQLGGLSLAFDDGDRSDAVVVHRRRGAERHAAAAASAPVDVPDWSRMVRTDSLESINGSVDDAEWVPPHVYLAREHGRSVTTSVFEGVGRTLKGRDMSRVRDAVWNQTGFFG